jgi:hypothetical protein
MGLCKEACLQTLNDREVSDMDNEERTTVFRIEDEHGEGPYTTVGSWSWADTDEHTGMVCHPCPSEDALDFKAPFHRCGFISRDQLDVWFSVSEQSRLLLQGFDIVELDVDARYLQVGVCQAIFVTDADIPDFKEGERHA